jgi:hypothetical protein
MKPLTAVSSAESVDAAAVYAGLARLAESIAAEDLPGFFAEIERARWTARLRLQAQATQNKPRVLLTVEETSRLLGGVSEGHVYRMAKGPLRSAAVEVGEGTLRFDPERVERFIEARRRG